MRFLASMILMLIVSGTAAADQYLRSEPKTYGTEGIRALTVQFSVGELRVEGDDVDQVQVSVRVRCRRGSMEDCEERARRVTIDRDVSGSRLTLEFKGIPKTNARGLSVEATLRVPRALATRIDMGVGELDVEGLAGELDVDLGVGDVEIRGETTDYGGAHAEVGVGDARIRAPHGRASEHGFIAHTARWSGDGKSTIGVHVGVGDVTIDLR